jgi:hypothetical protein
LICSYIFTDFLTLRKYVDSELKRRGERVLEVLFNYN